MFVSIVPSGVTSFTVVPFGSLSRFVTLSVKLTVPPFLTVSFSTVGSFVSAFDFDTVTVTVASSFVPSG